MAKWYGKVGYIITTESETSPGVWIPEPVEKYYQGDFNRDRKSVV